MFSFLLHIKPNLRNVQPTTKSGIINEILDAAAAGDQLRVVGAGHSFSGISLSSVKSLLNLLLYVFFYEVVITFLAYSLTEQFI